MQKILTRYKPEIDKKIIALCESTGASSVPWAKDVAERLADFATRGKTVRGSLLLFMTDLFTPHTENDTGVATVLELLHTALLIHDDIVDHDQIRRGKASIHAQYETLGSKRHVILTKEFGEGMALCVGDVAIFGAFSFLSELTLPQPIHTKITQTITKEFLIVGFGELHDIALGYLPSLPEAQEVLDMYRRKTARYTFSLPMMLGCLLANQSQPVVTMAEQLGETLGLIFQLRDDVLTLQGTTQEVGKTMGNDIAENKRTYPSVLLWQRASEHDKNILGKIFGKKEVPPSDLQTVIALMTTYGVLSDIDTTIQTLALKANQQISLLPITETQRVQFQAIVHYLQTRIK